MSKIFEEMIFSEEEMIFSEQDAKVVAEVTDQQITLTISVGNAIVVTDVLKQAAVAIAKDAVNNVLQGDRDEAEMLALIGMEITNFIDKTNKLIDGVAGSDELINIAKRSAAAAKGFASERKGTLQ